MNIEITDPALEARVRDVAHDQGREVRTIVENALARQLGMLEMPLDGIYGKRRRKEKESNNEQ